MNVHIVYDDSVAVPVDVRAVMGIESFGALVYRRRTLVQAIESVARAAGMSAVHVVRSSAQWQALSAALDRGELSGMFLVCPANIVAAASDEDLATLFMQARYAPGNLFYSARRPGPWMGWALMDATLIKAYVAQHLDGQTEAFFEAHASQFSLVAERIDLLDLSRERALMDYLSGTFDVRHFNAIEREGYTICKRSTDAAKLKREYDFYSLLPPRMQMFFIQPFDFQEDVAGASYCMERLFIPDMAVQWLQGAYQQPEFERFLDHVFHFLESRVQRPVERAVALRMQEALYATKVVERIDQLKNLPEYEALAPLLIRACGGIDRLLARYLKLFKSWRQRFPLNQLVIGHGDLCFSNILYSKTNQFMRLVDARGASEVDDLYTDPYYDAAKLSHSVLGNYDFINHDMFDVRVDEALTLALTLDRPNYTWARAVFNERLRRQGFDPLLTRLCEASLFISMLPLHIDRPRKVIGFVVNAHAIVNELEAEA